MNRLRKVVFPNSRRWNRVDISKGDANVDPKVLVLAKTVSQVSITFIDAKHLLT